MASITLKGRKVPLLYTSWEMKQVQEDLKCPIGQVMTRATGRNPENPKDTSRFGAPDHLEAVAVLIRILGNAGLEEAGEAADLTDKKVLRSLKPTELADAVNECINAINEGMKSEIPPDEETGPVDVTLEEMKKKEPKAD